MKKSKKIAGVGAYLWSAFLLNFLVSLLSGVAAVLMFALFYGGLLIFAGSSVAYDFVKYLDGQTDYYAETPIYFFVLLLVLILATIFASYFIARKEFPVRFRIFSKKYENVDTKKFFNFSIGFSAFVLVSQLVSSIVKEWPVDWIIVAGAGGITALAVVALFLGYRAGEKRV